MTNTVSDESSQLLAPAKTISSTVTNCALVVGVLVVSLHLLVEVLLLVQVMTILSPITMMADGVDKILGLTGQGMQLVEGIVQALPSVPGMGANLTSNAISGIGNVVGSVVGGDNATVVDTVQGVASNVGNAIS